jgi:hypothetical protein
MNAFYEHHKDSIRFGYRPVLRPVVAQRSDQPFQQPERVIGFFNSYRPAVSGEPGRIA